jgi:5-amino-6-(5-phospho-D-ribitylamino)uracil phosphatase
MTSTNPLYISDLDGTLLANDGKLSDVSLRTLGYLLKEGLPFTVASARSIVSIRQVLRGLPLALPVIEFNGAFISNYQTGGHQLTNNIQPGTVENLLRTILDHQHLPFVSAFDGEKDRLYYREIKNEGMEFYLDDRRKNNDHRLLQVRDFDSVLSQDVVCLTVIGKAEALQPLEKAIQKKHGSGVETHFVEDIYCRGWHWLTIHDHRATKDQAIRLLQEQTGLQDRELVVFGDHMNDIKMFKIADRSIAVSNAEPELKKHAHKIIGSNQDDSVAGFIEGDWRKS